MLNGTVMNFSLLVFSISRQSGARRDSTDNHAADIKYEIMQYLIDIRFFPSSR